MADRADLPCQSPEGPAVSIKAGRVADGMELRDTGTPADGTRGQSRYTGAPRSQLRPQAGGIRDPDGCRTHRVRFVERSSDPGRDAMIILNSVVTQHCISDDCMRELDGLDWAAANRLWARHKDCPPGCRAQLAAGAALSSENED